MSSTSREARGLPFGVKLTLWYACVFVLAATAWYYAVYYLIDNSLDKAWTLTRSRIVATWVEDTTGGQAEITLDRRRAVIEGHVPGNLNIAGHFQGALYKTALPIIVLGLLGGWIATTRGLRPLRDLGKTVRHILATGKTSARVPVSSHQGELAELIELFNRMLDRNDRLMQAMHESLDNVAHDLRTPMTRLRGAAELALQKEEDFQALREALADCMEESDRVLTILNTLMDVAEAETGTMPLEREELSVAELVRNVVEIYELVAEEKEITFETDLPEDLHVYADPTRLRQVLANLVDNAVKYSRNGQRVSISAQGAGNRVRIKVADQGMGIPRQEQNRIWDRLYRGDLSRGQRGLGLGLSFVKALVEAHDGTVSVESEPNRGSRFILELPRRRG